MSKKKKAAPKKVAPKKTSVELANDIERFLVVSEKAVDAASQLSAAIKAGMKKMFPDGYKNLDERLQLLQHQNDILHRIISTLVEDGDDIVVRADVAIPLDIIVDYNNNEIIVRRKEP